MSKYDHEKVNSVLNFETWTRRNLSHKEKPAIKLELHQHKFNENLDICSYIYYSLYIKL